jgi:hypothetical protein
VSNLPLTITQMLLPTEARNAEDASNARRFERRLPSHRAARG